MKYYLLQDGIWLYKGFKKIWKFDRFKFGVLDGRGNIVTTDTDDWDSIDPPPESMGTRTYDGLTS